MFSLLSLGAEFECSTPLSPVFSCRECRDIPVRIMLPIEVEPSELYTSTQSESVQVEAITSSIFCCAASDPLDLVACYGSHTSHPGVHGPCVLYAAPERPDALLRSPRRVLATCAGVDRHRHGNSRQRHRAGGGWCVQAEDHADQAAGHEPGVWRLDHGHLHACPGYCGFDDQGRVLSVRRQLEGGCSVQVDWLPCSLQLTSFCFQSNSNHTGSIYHHYPCYEGDAAQLSAPETHPAGRLAGNVSGGAAAHLRCQQLLGVRRVPATC